MLTGAERSASAMKCPVRALSFSSEQAFCLCLPYENEQHFDQIQAKLFSAHVLVGEELTLTSVASHPQP